MKLPVVNISALFSPANDRHSVATELRDACSEFGFFYIVGHGVDQQLQAHLSDLSRRFFDQPLAAKLEVDMSHGGRAWRGYFPVGAELTSGKPDLKEGIYFGAELGPDHPMVQARTPLHGPNLFPARIPQFRETILDYIASMTRLGHALMSGISLGLGLKQSYFADAYTADPLILFRIFNYPARSRYSHDEYAFGVGEHTDYGFLTILKQDMSGGLQIKSKSQWIDVEPISNSFVCNIGDMLDRLTGGRYLSAPHRVQHRGEHDRLSFAFFFDPNFNAEIKPLHLGGAVRDNKADRWDRASVHEFRGTYGDYLLGKVSKVFPQLGREVL
jgi:isopenicillin N synthase-like dioxygenase